MNSLFEYSDRLNFPYECFIADNKYGSFPTKPHWHYFMEILYIIKGNARIGCDEKRFVAEPGDLVLFLPNQIHSIYEMENEALQSYVLKFDMGQLTGVLDKAGQVNSGIHYNALFRIAKKEPAAVLHFHKGEFAGLEELFQKICKEAGNKEYGSDSIMQSYIRILLTLILRKWRENGFDTDKCLAVPSDEDMIYWIAEYIDSHIQDNLRVEELAEKCHMSYSYFARVFHEIYGQSCKKYIEFIRLCKAENLLLFTKLDLNYISQETGFSDCSYFIKAFKAKYGVTPGQYRIEHGKLL